MLLHSCNSQVILSSPKHTNKLVLVPGWDRPVKNNQLPISGFSSVRHSGLIKYALFPQPRPVSCQQVPTLDMEHQCTNEGRAIPIK